MSDLNDLEQRLKAAQAKHAELNPPHVQTRAGNEMATGIRAFMEMVGVILGSGLMGYALDRFFETAPTLLFIFIVLGIVAAIFNLYKLSQNLGTAIGSKNLQSPDKMARKSPENESQD